MSDPQPNPGKRTPPRAEPLQPDRLGSGDDPATDGRSGGSDPGGTDRGSNAQESVERQKQQSEDALKNVRDGYR